MDEGHIIPRRICPECGKKVEPGLWSWVEHVKNDCTEEVRAEFAAAAKWLESYGEYLKKHPKGIKLSDHLN
jgi:hypothetical protein